MIINNKNQQILYMTLSWLRSVICIAQLFQTFLQSSPRRVAVPVLVKDGKPCSNGESLLDNQIGHNDNDNVKSEYLLPSSHHHNQPPHHHHHHHSEVNPELMTPLPALMHMGGYGAAHHAAAAAAQHHREQLNQTQTQNMCAYLPHRTSWQ